jgi:hypothetical protein
MIDYIGTILAMTMALYGGFILKLRHDVKLLMVDFIDVYLEATVIDSIL